MLQSLYIKNFALIDEIHIDFQNGLNIVLGETGAGKSIVIDALMATLGERTSPEFVKSGELKAVVEATFSVDDPQIINSILNDPENTVNNLLILRREIFSKGTTRCFLNDTPYPLNVIKEIGEYLVDFHGQHSHQQLLSPKFQIELLDSVSDTEKLLQNYRDLRKHLEETIGLLRKTEDDLMHLYKENEKISFDLQELLRINPQPNELTAIETQLKKLENQELINSTLNEIYEILYKSDRSVIDSISFSIKRLGSLLKYDSSFEELIHQLEITLENISEVSNEIQKKFIEIDFEPEYIENLRTRLAELKYLEKKYLTYDNIFSEKERLQNLVLSSYSLEENIKHYKAKISQVKDTLKEVALQIHNQRLKGIELLENKIPEIIEKLGMKNVVFKVAHNFDEMEKYEITDLTIELNGEIIKLLPNGIDRIEFLISTSPGTKPLPLSTITSGGELSRLMLALKSIAAQRYQFPTMIFDEIDVGISGKIASMTGQLMKNIAKNHQIIAITHLPQIASAAENIILIEKKESKGRFQITAKKLDEKERIFEIARLLSGEVISEFAIENAKKLIAEINASKL
ncbi:MAG: DNA repair protein RecN [Candidatus Kapaibacteriota bacterium]